jgi:hypothetical protein
MVTSSSKLVRRSLVAAATMLVLAGASVLTTALTTAPAQAAGGVTATLSLDSDWGSGYQAKYTIANSSSAAISSWTVTFDLPSGTAMGSYWDTLITTSGQHVTAKNREYNGTVAPGTSVTFGFIASGGGKPTNCLINGGSCTGSSDTTAPTAPANLRSTGVTANSVSLAWNASTDNVGVTGYDIYRGGTLATSVTGTTGTVSGLSPSTTYTFTVKARDAAGNASAASNSVSVTTPTGPPPPPPSAVPVAPYIDMGAWPTPILSTVASASTVKSYTLAFITASGCKAMWFNAYDPRAGWQLDEITKIRNAGGDVKISFGGASGVELAQACSSVSALTAEYQAVINAYSLKYIDFDIEGAGVAEPASIALRNQAMKALQAANPNLRISLTLPVLPEGLDANGLNVVRSARDAGVNLDSVNVMAMDYYRAGDYGDFAVQAANSTFNQLKALYPAKTDAQLWKMVGVTPMLGVNDDGRIYNQDDARQLVAFAKTKHLGMLAFWEVTRDRNACTGALYMCTNIPQAPYEFSKIFAGYTG